MCQRQKRIKSLHVVSPPDDTDDDYYLAGNLVSLATGM